MEYFLRVPFVRYVDRSFYLDRARPVGLELEYRTRISAMNVLTLRRSAR
jgi:hypothetical protein